MTQGTKSKKKVHVACLDALEEGSSTAPISCIWIGPEADESLQYFLPFDVEYWSFAFNPAVIDVVVDCPEASFVSF